MVYAVLSLLRRALYENCNNLSDDFRHQHVILDQVHLLIATLCRYSYFRGRLKKNLNYLHLYYLKIVYLR